MDTAPWVHLLLDAAGLPGPATAVEEGAQVEAVVVGAVALGMVGGRKRGHLVPVGRVLAEEAHHFLGHLSASDQVKVQLLDPSRLPGNSGGPSPRCSPNE